jgi:hypothetical protein
LVGYFVGGVAPRHPLTHAAQTDGGDWSTDGVWLTVGVLNFVGAADKGRAIRYQRDPNPAHAATSCVAV